MVRKYTRHPSKVGKRVIFGFGVRLSLDDIVAVAYGAQVTISPRTRQVLKKRRAEVVEFVTRSKTPAYGFNRGFGHNVSTPVPPNQLKKLQLNLIRSHSSGVGPSAPVEVVRAAMLIRAHALAQGHSAVRPIVIETLAALLNHQITPHVPLYGSVGASGDLAPLSHIALTAIGEGLAYTKSRNRPVAASAALKRAKIRPLELEMKEGLALNNGLQFSTALGIIAAHKLSELLGAATIASALTAQVMLGSDAPYLPELHELRPHPGTITIAKDLNRIMRGSPIRRAHRDPKIDGEVQDPYNLRCASQILGACADLVAEAKACFLIEANSVTDNPVILKDRRTGKFTRIISGGLFHGMPVATKLYNLIQAAGIIARLSNMRCARFVDESRNRGLGSDLIWPQLNREERSSSSGMMIPEYVSAALTNQIWGEAMPTHLFSISTDAGQEDHVSMATGVAVRAFEMLPRLAEVIAIELAYAAQAAAIRKVLPGFPSRNTLNDSQGDTIKARLDFRGSPALVRLKPSARALSPLSESILREIYRHFPVVKGDRSLSEPLARLSQCVLSGVISRFLH